MYGINLTETGFFIEMTILLLFPIMLWGLYKFDQYQGKKMAYIEIKESDQVKHNSLH